MVELFHSYWWLLIPLGWFVYSGWTSWLNYRRQRQTLDVVRRFAETGKDVPPELMKVLDQPIDSEKEFWGGGLSGTYEGGGSGGGSGYAFSVVMFAALAGAFGYAAWRDFYGNGDAFMLVAFILGALALATLASWIFRKRG